MHRRRAGRAAGGPRAPPSGVTAAGSVPLVAKTAEPADKDRPAAACDDDDALEGLGLGRNWFTQAFRDSNVNFQHRRRQLRLISPYIPVILVLKWAHDLFEADFGTIDPDDTLLISVTVARFVAPLVGVCTLFALRLAGG